MTTIPCSLVELLTCLRHNPAQDELWGALVEYQWPMVYGLAKRLTGSAELAYDASQETFLKIIELVPGFQPINEAATQAWILSIASNQARSLRRKEARRRGQVLDQDPAYALDAAFEAEIEGEIEATATYRMELVRDGLATLPERHRQPLQLRYLMQFSYAQVGEALACSAEAARKRVQTALMALRQRLAACVALTPLALGSDLELLGQTPVHCPPPPPIRVLRQSGLPGRSQHQQSRPLRQLGLILAGAGLAALVTMAIINVRTEPGPGASASASTTDSAQEWIFPEVKAGYRQQQPYISRPDVTSWEALDSLPGESLRRLQQATLTAPPADALRALGLKPGDWSGTEQQIAFSLSDWDWSMLNGRHTEPLSLRLVVEGTFVNNRQGRSAWTAGLAQDRYLPLTTRLDQPELRLLTDTSQKSHTPEVLIICVVTNIGTAANGNPIYEVTLFTHDHRLLGTSWSLGPPKVLAVLLHQIQDVQIHRVRRYLRSG